MTHFKFSIKQMKIGLSTKSTLQLDYLIKSISLGLCLIISNLLTAGAGSVAHHGGQFLLLLLIFAAFNYALTGLPYYFFSQTWQRFINALLCWWLIIIALAAWNSWRTHLFLQFNAVYVPITHVRYLFWGGLCSITFSWIERYLKKNRCRTAYVIGRASPDLQKLTSFPFLIISNQANSEDLPSYLLDALIIDLKYHPTFKNCRTDLFLQSMARNIPVYSPKKWLENYEERLRLDTLQQRDLLALNPQAHPYIILKRILDILCIVIALPIILPLFLVVALIIRIESHGPAIFTQNRVGYLGQEFKIYKFRSMYHQAENSGARFASKQDIRITRIGKFIRQLRIDELPQIFNVLKGDMSLIGPRPEQKIFVDQFNKEIPYYRYRHYVKPGISGLAQVKQGYAANTKETAVKLEYDLFYIKHLSLGLDILIFIKTLRTIFTGFGAR